MAKIVSDNKDSDHVYSRQVHSPSIPSPPLNSRMTPDPIEKNLLLLKNQSALMLTSNGYADLYSSDSEDEPVFEEMVSTNTINSINTYYVVPLNTTLASTPT